ncbi:branched-chain amino acid ABC transporter permease [Cupriavidus pauculus]|uniref:Branched-chain amino acid ABC transporter permease n=1 Tax=Cupriavidus pauculus TaxID=82633 RepID=A0A2N5C8D8_9BURK|nr:branched-chain amino acid ABC transporter permease [Cupriavidus pauculus]PLP98469.1 branched-chain amino acid ABC transporter permease [Cupriavidus pauculus]
MNDSKSILSPSMPKPALQRPGTGTLLRAAGMIALALAPLVAGDPFTIHLAILVCINAIVVSGLTILSRAGQVSLCHGAFVGIGAYVAVFTGMGANLPFPVAVVAAMMAGGVCAFLLGAIMLRLSGVYFVLVTFAFGELVRLGLLEWDTVTGGANGIAGIPAATLLGYSLEDKPAFYAVVALVTVGVTALLAILLRSPAGQAVDTVGENPALAESSGVSVRGTQLFAFTASGVLAGLGGALTAYYLGYISPESFSLHLSTAVIIMMVVGGRKALLGPLVGALVMTPLPELFRGAVQTQTIFYGVALILMLRFLPQGLASLPISLASTLGRSRRNAP